MESGKYYVLSEGKNLSEGMTKEQILAAIVQAVETHEISDVDTGFVSKLKEGNKNKQLTFWIGTTAEYNAIQTPVENCFYILTDENDLDELEAEIEQLAESVDSIAGCKGIILLNQTVPYGTGMVVPLLGDKAITEYTLVNVTVADLNGVEVLCNVSEKVGLVEISGVQGIVIPDSTLTGVNSIRNYTVNITCDTESNIITNLVTCAIYDTATGTTTTNCCGISKIKGVY